MVVDQIGHHHHHHHHHFFAANSARPTSSQVILINPLSTLSHPHQPTRTTHPFPKLTILGAIHTIYLIPITFNTTIQPTQTQTPNPKSQTTFGPKIPDHHYHHPIHPFPTLTQSLNQRPIGIYSDNINPRADSDAQHLGNFRLTIFTTTQSHKSNPPSQQCPTIPTQIRRPLVFSTPVSNPAQGPLQRG